jgi:hypothetical protein
LDRRLDALADRALLDLVADEGVARIVVLDELARLVGRRESDSAVAARNFRAEAADERLLLSIADVFILDLEEVEHDVPGQAVLVEFSLVLARVVLELAGLALSLALSSRFAVFETGRFLNNIPGWLKSVFVIGIAHVVPEHVRRSSTQSGVQHPWHS